MWAQPSRTDVVAITEARSKRSGGTDCRPMPFVKHLELGIECRQSLICDGPDRAQRVRGRYPPLHIDVRRRMPRRRIRQLSPDSGDGRVRRQPLELVI